MRYLDNVRGIDFIDTQTQYVLSLSYGKDSTACLGAIRELGWPLHRVVTADVWATDTIPADLPPMIQFKEKLDQYIKDKFGIEVEHVCAMRCGEKITYEKLFYHVPVRRGDSRWGRSQDFRILECHGAMGHSSATSCDKSGSILGFPIPKGPWCTSDLKRAALKRTFLLAPWHEEQV